MNKKWAFGLFFLFFLIIYYLFGSFAQELLRPISSTIRGVFVSAMGGFSGQFERHFSQVETITQLQKENRELQQQALSFKARLKTQADAAYLVQSRPTVPELVTISETSVLSYSSLPNLYRLWIDFRPKLKRGNEKRTIVGLVYPTQNKIDSVTCGIAIQSDNNGFEAYLNGDAKCSYAVYIGKQKAPGILIGRNQNRLIVKYVPTWMEIKAGDEVVTSGLDEIFFEGVRVGVVTNVFSDNAYKEALVEPYFNSLNPTKFYAVEINKAGKP